MSKRPYKPLNRYNTLHCESTVNVESCSMLYMKPCSCVESVVNTQGKKTEVTFRRYECGSMIARECHWYLSYATSKTAHVFTTDSQ